MKHDMTLEEAITKIRSGIDTEAPYDPECDCSQCTALTLVLSAAEKQNEIENKTCENCANGYGEIIGNPCITCCAECRSKWNRRTDNEGMGRTT